MYNVDFQGLKGLLRGCVFDKYNRLIELHAIGCGFIPKNLSELNKLRILDLSIECSCGGFEARRSNHELKKTFLVGPIPHELSLLQNLETLKLDGN